LPAWLGRRFAILGIGLRIQLIKAKQFVTKEPQQLEDESMNLNQWAATFGPLGALRISEFHIFERVAGLLSMSAAGRDLCLSPAVVSKHIAFLEESCGAKLFRRDTRNMMLTDAGQALLDGMQPIVEAVRVVEAAMLAGVKETELPFGRSVLGHYLCADGTIETAYGHCDRMGTWWRAWLSEQGAPTFVRQAPQSWEALPGLDDERELSRAA
jgi:hypothetical protein